MNNSNFMTAIARTASIVSKEYDFNMRVYISQFFCTLKPSVFKANFVKPLVLKQIPFLTYHPHTLLYHKH